MTLDVRIAALASAIGADIKTLTNAIASVGGGSGVPTYIQQTEPVGPAIWYKTDADGAVIDILRVT